MIYLSGGTDAFRQTLLIELYPKKPLMSAKRGEKAMKIQSPCGFPQGFRCLHVHYTLSHIENQPAAKKFMFTMFDEKRGFPIFFLGFVRIFSDFRQNSGMLKILCILMQKKLLQFVHIPGFRDTPNWVSRASTVHRTIDAPVLLFANATEFRFLRKATQGAALKIRKFSQRKLD